LCASKLARKKETEKREREDKIKYKDMRIRAKSTDYAKELQSNINKLARQIDVDFGYLCIDCSRPFGKQTDGAHFHSVGSHPSVRFNLHNIHAARSDCNNFSEDHKLGYIDNLKARYGEV
jgi:5-methylcytosine-specific restriction endonuclease McrA